MDNVVFLCTGLYRTVTCSSDTADSITRRDPKVDQYQCGHSSRPPQSTFAVHDDFPAGLKCGPQLGADIHPGALESLIWRLDVHDRQVVPRKPASACLVRLCRTLLFHRL